MEATSLRKWIACALVAGTAACASRPPDDSRDYAAKVAADRAAKDAAFLAANGPSEIAARSIPAAGVLFHRGLITASAALKPSNDRTIIEMPTSTGTNRKMRRAGAWNCPEGAAAQTDGIERGRRGSTTCSCRSGDHQRNGDVPAGRFMDLNRNGRDLRGVDFNRAYPVLLLQPDMRCPYPPKENRLNIPIRAGERMKK